MDGLRNGNSLTAHSSGRACQLLDCIGGHSAPLNSALGSRGNFLTNSNDTEAEKRVNNVIVTKRRSHKAASQDWGRASRYALIELPRKPSAANDKGAPNMGIQRTRIPASRYPFGHSGPLIPGVRQTVERCYNCKRESKSASFQNSFD